MPAPVCDNSASKGKSAGGSAGGTLSPLILAVETSCDETACALLADGRIVGEKVHSQRRRHRPFGGVVPELASRDHLRRLLPMIDELLRESPSPPTHYAYTAGPGLAGSLLAGAAVANALAFAAGRPAMAINHLAGHLLSPQLSRPDFTFPYLTLLVSGGHTQLWETRGAEDFVLLGQTLDDAAGEAFDKTAVLLGLGYPGGAALEKLAAEGDGSRFPLPSPLQPNCNFSFSGLKTAVRRLVQKESAAAESQSAKKESPTMRHLRADIAASFQRAAAEGLARQTAAAAKKIGAKRIAVVGGVAQNNETWRRLQHHCPAADLHRPRPSHCGDNAAMIALAAFLQLRQRGQKKSTSLAFAISPRWQPV